MAPATLTAPISAEASATETDSARRAGGPEDRALYACACGHAFMAPVSTSVGCPRCGASQAW
jgi:Zn finger protein HypA/HybF involved in hydrogenase expression